MFSQTFEGRRPNSGGRRVGHCCVTLWFADKVTLGKVRFEDDPKVFHLICPIIRPTCVENLTRAFYYGSGSDISN